jgi:hypothetical protein
VLAGRSMSADFKALDRFTLWMLVVGGSVLARREHRSRQRAEQRHDIHGAIAAEPEEVNRKPSRA